MAAPPTQNQDRLRSHFSSLEPSSHASGWDDLWRAGDFIPWDRGYANPALIDFLAHPTSPPVSGTPNPTAGAPKQGVVDGQGIKSLPQGEGRRGRALVPGCGKGYDVALLASYGYDTWGLEVSAHAAEAAKKYFANAGDGSLEGEYRVKDEKLGTGKMECLLGDFFEEGWVKEIGAEEGGFDIIYDNTVRPPSPEEMCRWV
jgi:SAM-dependent methyltransferase